LYFKNAENSGVAADDFPTRPAGRLQLSPTILAGSNLAHAQCMAAVRAAEHPRNPGLQRLQFRRVAEFLTQTTTSDKPTMEYGESLSEPARNAVPNLEIFAPHGAPHATKLC